MTSRRWSGCSPGKVWRGWVVMRKRVEKWVEENCQVVGEKGVDAEKRGVCFS